MHPSKTRRPLFLSGLFLAFLLLLSIPAGELLAEAPILANWTISSPGKKSLPIAVPRPKTAGDTPVDEFWSVVRHDLEISGWFRVLDPDAFVEPAHAGVRLGEFEFAD